MRLRASLSMRLGSLSLHSSPSCMCSRYIFRYLPRLPLTAEVPRPEASPMTPFSVAGFSKPGSVSKLSQISLADWHRWKHTYRKVRVARCCRCPNCLPGIPCQEHPAIVELAKAGWMDLPVCFVQSVPSGGPAQLKGVFAGWFVDVIALIKFRVPVQSLSSLLANGVIGLWWLLILRCKGKGSGSSSTAQHCACLCILPEAQEVQVPGGRGLW